MSTKPVITPIDIALAMYLEKAGEEAKKRGALLDMPMRNGKRLRDCTCGEVREEGDWFIAVGDYIAKVQAGES